MLKYEFIPARDPGSKRLWVMLHGLGDSIDGYRWMPEAMDLPWMNYALVNAPDEYYGGYSWFDFAGDMTPGVLRSRKLLFALLDELRSRGHPTEKTILGGFSQGCLMAVDVGLRYPQAPAGIVGISGWVYEPGQLLEEMTADARQRAVLMTHGTLDPMIPFAAVRAEVRKLIAAGLPVEWHEFQKAHTIAGEEELDVIRGFVERRFAGPNAP
ncbi:MAG: serine esterase [Verrucomicrobia bacterium]|jgi:phospholipase/carboxylesterase|nr:serine esterase [Verrucomicrobiota bacterium]